MGRSLPIHQESLGYSISWIPFEIIVNLRVLNAYPLTLNSFRQRHMKKKKRFSFNILQKKKRNNFYVIFPFWIFNPIKGKNERLKQSIKCIEILHTYIDSLEKKWKKRRISMNIQHFEDFIKQPFMQRNWKKKRIGLVIKMVHTLPFMTY